MIMKGMINMTREIIVKKGITNEYKLDKYSATTYVALRMIFNNHNISEQVITIDNIVYQLTGEFDNGNKHWQEKLKKNISIGLDKLVELNLIKILATNKKSYLIDADELAYINTDKERFEMLTTEQIREMYAKGGMDMFLYYLTFIGKIYNTDTFANGNMFLLNSRKDMAEEFNIDVKTFDKYNDILEELEIIYIYRYDCRFANSGKTPLNMYGMNNEVVIDAMNKSANKLMKEHEMTKGVVVKGKTKAELSNCDAKLESYIEHLEAAYNDYTPVVVKVGFYNKNGERITTKKKAIVEPQIKLQQEKKVEVKSCEPNMIQLNKCQNSGTEPALTFSEMLEHYKEIGELF